MNPDWHRSILRKMPSCPQRKGFLHMHLPVVIVGVTNGDKLLLTKYNGREYKKYALVPMKMFLGLNR